MTMRFDTIERAITEIKSGKAVVVVDDEDISEPVLHRAPP
jgi:3,4-dihydroxy-2-butanone 4-phosphate synthase